MVLFRSCFSAAGLYLSGLDVVNPLSLLKRDMFRDRFRHYFLHTSPIDDSLHIEKPIDGDTCLEGDDAMSPREGNEDRVAGPDRRQVAVCLQE